MRQARCTTSIAQKLLTPTELNNGPFFSYENGILSVIVPQDFLDTAVYPVRVDPTFGKALVALSVLVVWKTPYQEDFLRCRRQVMLRHLTAEIGISTANKAAKLAIYDSSGNFIVQSNELTVLTSQTGTQIQFNLASSESLTAANYYLTAWGASAGGFMVLEGAGSGGTSFVRCVTDLRSKLSCNS